MIRLDSARVAELVTDYKDLVQEALLARADGPRFDHLPPLTDEDIA